MNNARATTQTSGSRQVVVHTASYNTQETFHTIGDSSCRTPDGSADNASGELNLEVLSPPQQPYALMKFDTLKDAEDHYRLYARNKGFGIRYDYRRKSDVDGEIARVSLVCHRQGKKLVPKEDPQNPKSVVKE